MAVKSRRKAREVAMRALYELEIGHMPLAMVLKENLGAAELPEDLHAFASLLITGVREHQAAIDDLLAKVITDWDFDRIAPVDRNVLRVATYELFHCPNIPPAVTINEAIEIGKKYSTAETGKFVNGVLGQVLKESPKAVWSPPAEIEEEIAPAEQEEETPVETLAADSDEAKRLAKVGGWKLKSEGEKP
jgi:transcription antitermination protein NusB